MNNPLASFGSQTPSHVASLKITPSNSPIAKSTQKSPIRSNFSSAVLSLQKVIGTTTSSQCGFACHGDSRKIALCAGSAVLLAEFDEQYHINQRFYRALPTVSASNHAISARPTIQHTPSDGRRRSLAPSMTPSRATVSVPPPSPSREWSESESFKTWTSRKRIKATSSVDISCDGKYLAVGETGYSPRVLIFSTSKESSTDTPVSIMSEHSSGIRSVAFSPDSQYLASLGDINDGFLYVYAFNQRRGSLKLHCTNKCTAWVRDMTWFGNNLITVGTRHVKVWKVPETIPISPSKSGRHRLENELSSSPGAKALTGRNTVLGPLADFNFTCVVGLSNERAILCSDNGAICVLEDAGNRQELKLVKTLPWKVYSVGIDRERKGVWFGGQDHRMHYENIDIFESLRSPSVMSGSTGSSTGSSISHPNSPIRRSRDDGSRSIVAISCLGQKLVYLDSQRNLGMRDESKAKESTEAAPIELLTPAHSGPIQGIRVLRNHSDSGAFFTWSRDGNVRLWDVDGNLLQSTTIELEQIMGEDEPENELKALCTSPDETYLISGDRFGVIRVLKRDTWTQKHTFKAHTSEITDVSVTAFAAGFLLATSGRDRIVQLLHKTEDELSLAQTMDEHVGSVSGLMFAIDGDRLVSYSSDRTIVIRQRFTNPAGAAIYSPQRVITLKASPVSIAFHPTSPELMIVSTMDRHILRFDLGTGVQLHSYKTLDPDDNDTFIMDSITINKGPPTSDIPYIISGVSSTDKSIRVYDYARDVLLTREFGHTEGVSDVAVLEHSQPESSGTNSCSEHTLVSTGLDGIIMLWKLSLPSARPIQEMIQPVIDSPNGPPVKDFVASKTPLRRVLSKSDLTEYTRFDPNLGTTTPLREQSPPRVRRRPSKFGNNLSSRFDTSSEDSPTSTLTPRQARQGSPTSKLDVPHSSTIHSSSAISGESTSHQNEFGTSLPNTNLRAKGTFDSLQKSSSPTPSHNLRRRSSIPNHIHHVNRSKSSSNLRTEFGTVNAAGDQTSRALKAYRKKVELCNENELDHKILEEVEKELQMTIECLHVKLERVQSRHRSVAQSSQDSDDDGVASAASTTILSEEGSENSQHHNTSGGSGSEATTVNEASGEG